MAVLLKAQRWHLQTNKETEICILSLWEPDSYERDQAAVETREGTRQRCKSLSS